MMYLVPTALLDTFPPHPFSALQPQWSPGWLHLNLVTSTKIPLSRAHSQVLGEYKFGGGGPSTKPPFILYILSSCSAPASSHAHFPQRLYPVPQTCHGPFYIGSGPSGLCDLKEKKDLEKVLVLHAFPLCLLSLGYQLSQYFSGSSHPILCSLGTHFSSFMTLIKSVIIHLFRWLMFFFFLT